MLTSLAAALALLPGLQDPQPDTDNLVVRVKPAEVRLVVGQSVQLEAEVVDVGGRPAKGDVFWFSRARRSVTVDRSGKVTARAAGEFEVIARLVTSVRGRAPSGVCKVTVVRAQPDRVEIQEAPAELFVGTMRRLVGRVMDDAGGVRDDLAVQIETTDAGVASVDDFGFIECHKPGRVTLTASGGGMRVQYPLQIVANPVAKIELSASTADTVRQGDVITFAARALDANGQELDVPVHFSCVATPDDNLGNGATGQIEQDGRFVAETPGIYTIVATCGDVAARKNVRATKRFEQKRKLQLVGHGRVADTHTSDLWVWEGVDGRDYAVTGTWGANGDAHFWDVTDPSNLKMIATAEVDARTVNDVKVSEDGKLCILSREGASNRKNGIVILNVEDPRNPKLVAQYDDELTGGVHNLYIDKGYVYALSAGRRYDVIDIRDAAAPTRVSSFQLFEPGASIHDVWINDGIAYSSNWRYGLRLVDVGKGIAGGSPDKPVEFASYAYPNGWNHAAFPFTSPQTGKFYVIGGDEAFPYGLNVTGKPTYPRGWFHFVDFSNPKAPREVARYEVPEAGTHNLWVEGDVLYGAYYNGGLRVVDISGDLMGDLYRQGREIAWFLPDDPEGHIPNAPMVWGPQPYKGNIFFSDWNSGLWCVKLVPDTGRRR